MSALTRIPLSDPQVHFFSTFGYLKIPALFDTEEMARLSHAFDDVFATEERIPLDPANEIHNARRADFEGDVRDMIFEFIDKSPDLVWLRDDPRITGIVSSLLGDEVEEMPADGNIMNCDVSYHSDVYGSGMMHTNIKIFFYLDPLDRETGALRMIPGTNHHPSPYGKLIRSGTLTPEKTRETFDLPPEDIPSVAIDLEPGDIIVGDFRTVHGSFKGAPGRRLFTLNYRVRPGEN